MVNHTNICLQLQEFLWTDAPGFGYPLFEDEIDQFEADKMIRSRIRGKRVEYTSVFSGICCYFLRPPTVATSSGQPSITRIDQSEFNDGI